MASILTPSFATKSDDNLEVSGLLVLSARAGARIRLAIDLPAAGDWDRQTNGPSPVFYKGWGGRINWYSAPLK